MYSNLYKNNDQKIIEELTYFCCLNTIIIFIIMYFIKLNIFIILIIILNIYMNYFYNI